MNFELNHKLMSYKICYRTKKEMKCKLKVKIKLRSEVVLGFGQKTLIIIILKCDIK